MHKINGFNPSLIALIIFYKTTIQNAIVFPVPDLKFAIAPKLNYINKGTKTYCGSNGFSYPLQKIEDNTFKSKYPDSNIFSNVLEAIFYLSTL